jgi:hypothetical protein
MRTRVAASTQAPPSRVFSAQPDEEAKHEHHAGRRNHREDDDAHSNLPDRGPPGSFGRRFLGPIH